MCSKFNMLLGLEERNEGCISKETQSSKCIRSGGMIHKLFK